MSYGNQQWQEHLLEKTVGGALWESNVPICCLGVTIGIMLNPQMLSPSHAVLASLASGKEGRSALWAHYPWILI